MNGDVVTLAAFRRELATLPLAARRRLVEQMRADVDLVEGVATMAEWMSFRLRAALAKRAGRHAR